MSLPLPLSLSVSVSLSLSVQGKARYTTYDVLRDVLGGRDTLEPCAGGPTIQYDALTDQIAIYNEAGACMPGCCTGLPHACTACVCLVCVL